jgi:hypothetical protein
MVLTLVKFGTEQYDVLAYLEAMQCNIQQADAKLLSKILASKGLTQEAGFLEQLLQQRENEAKQQHAVRPESAQQEEKDQHKSYKV